MTYTPKIFCNFAAYFVGKTDKITKKHVGKTDKIARKHVGKTDKERS